MTIYKLRKLYYDNKVKKKCIRLTKIPTRTSLERITLEAADLSNKVNMALEKGFRIVQVDECYVTKNTMSSEAWSLPKENCTLDYQSKTCEVKAVIAAVSREFGLDHFMVFRHSVTKAKYK